MAAGRTTLSMHQLASAAVGEHGIPARGPLLRACRRSAKTPPPLLHLRLRVRQVEPAPADRRRPTVPLPARGPGRCLVSDRLQRTPRRRARPPPALLRRPTPGPTLDRIVSTARTPMCSAHSLRVLGASIQLSCMTTFELCAARSVLQSGTPPWPFCSNNACTEIRKWCGELPSTWGAKLRRASSVCGKTASSPRAAFRCCWPAVMRCTVIFQGGVVKS